jgi:hypothetical protein
VLDRLMRSREAGKYRWANLWLEMASHREVDRGRFLVHGMDTDGLPCWPCNGVRLREQISPVAVTRDGSSRVNFLAEEIAAS